MNKALLTLAILAGFLFPTTNTEAQIFTESGVHVEWIVVDGTDRDDTVHIYDVFGGTQIDVYNHLGDLVDSMFVRNPAPRSPFRSLYGNKPTAIYAFLKGGDDFYFNSSTQIYGEVVCYGSGNDTIHAGPGESFVLPSLRDTGSNEIYGGDGDDWLVGDAGDDRIEGGNGNDDIEGGDGNDELYGDAGNDVIDGGHDFNLLFGGTGKDKFLSAGQSVIHDE